MAAVMIAAVLLLPFWGPDAHAQPVDGVLAYLEGRITVNPEIDETENYSGFELLVMQDRLGEPDTLGFATTNEDGLFSMEIFAPERGIYPLVISRHGDVLNVTEFIVAHGDSGVVQAVLPARDGTIRVRSNENAAWMAYQNLMSQHNQMLIERLQEDLSDEEAFEEQMQFTASMLWNMRESFGGTVGAEIAVAESILMLEGWDDELVLERADAIAPDAPGYVEVGRAVRKAVARTAGQEEAIRRLQTFIERTDDVDRQAALRAEIIQARLDSLEQDQARAALTDLQRNHPDSPWTEWGERAIYQFERLSPGMPAPALSVRTMTGEQVSLEDFRGQLLLVEFIVPQNSIFQRELDFRRTVHEGFREEGFEILTISLDPDDAVNEALFIDRDIPGVYAVAPEGVESPLVEAYNVMTMPTRYLIDEDGNILQSYVEGSMMAVAEDLAALLGVEDPDVPDADNSEN